MNSKIIDIADKLVKKYKTRNPFELISAMNIELMFDSSFSKLKGFYTVMNRQSYIVINSNMSDEEIKIVAAHELGHHVLHKKLASKSALQEFELYNMNTKSEYEANSFAAEILISDNDILELIEIGYNMEQIASKLKTNVNLIGIKLNNFNTKGTNYNIGIVPRSDFLKT